MTLAARILDTEVARPLRGERVLITGASGFIGGHVARQALAAGVRAHSLGRSPGLLGCRHHPADLRDAAAVARILADVAPVAVIHCAAQGVIHGSAGLAQMLSDAVTSTQSLYAACASLRVPPKVIHVGSGFEYAASALPVSEAAPIVPAGSDYGAAKAVAAVVAGAFAHCLSISLLRPFHVYGVGEARERLARTIMAKVRRGERVALTAGEQQRDFLHVDDCAGCFWRALARPGATAGLAIYNLGSGEPRTVREFVTILAGALQTRGYTAQLDFGALPYRAHEPLVSLPDTTRWCSEFAWRPRVALRDGIEELVRAELEP